MTSFKINLREMLAHEATRTSAITVRKKIIALLCEYDCVQIDLENVNFTPSVADEIIGALALEFGPVEFKQKIQITNVSESQRALMHHVIARRLTNSEKKESVKSNDH